MKGFKIKDGVLKKYIGNDICVTIPDNVTKIGYGAFDDCTSLKQITIPNSVTKIGEYAFFKCTSLKEITIPNSVNEIRDSAFCGCESLKEIIIPESVTEISDNVFSDCISFKKIIIPDSVTEISDFAFDGCTSLEEITLPNNITKIGDYAFCNCNSLKKVTIPDSITEIGDSAFHGCKLKTPKSYYKAFSLNENNQLQCRDYIFDENKEPVFIKNIKICESGYHYCTNLFEIFDYYSGCIDKDIAIYKIKPIRKILKEKNSSKCCCQSFKFKKRLHREDVIRILNGGK